MRMRAARDKRQGLAAVYVKTKQRLRRATATHCSVAGVRAPDPRHHHLHQTRAIYRILPSADPAAGQLNASCWLAFNTIEPQYLFPLACQL